MLRAEITSIIMSRQAHIFAFLTFSLRKSQLHLLSSHEKAYE